MIANGIEDEDKWLTEGIARIQHNCFLYASRTGNSSDLSVNISSINSFIFKTLILRFVCSSGLQQSQRSPIIFGANVV
ncbi:hypothetical protein ACSBR1_016321 [Camellia fascicularis]